MSVPNIPQCVRPVFFAAISTAMIWVAGMGSSAAAQKAAAEATQASEQPTQCPICHISRDDTTNYPTKMGNRLLRGAANILFGWTELILQPAKNAQEGDGVITGIAKGLGQSVTRTAGGALEVLTFWTPKVEGRYLQFSEDCPICMGTGVVQPSSDTADAAENEQ